MLFNPSAFVPFACIWFYVVFRPATQTHSYTRLWIDFSPRAQQKTTGIKYARMERKTISKEVTQCVSWRIISLRRRAAGLNTLGVCLYAFHVHVNRIHLPASLTLEHFTPCLTSRYDIFCHDQVGYVATGQQCTYLPASNQSDSFCLTSELRWANRIDFEPRVCTSS